MEDKIGEIVTLLPSGIKARVVEVQTADCRGCYYHENNICCWDHDDTHGDCNAKYRKDHKNKGEFKSVSYKQPKNPDGEAAEQRNFGTCTENQGRKGAAVIRR